MAAGRKIESEAEACRCLAAAKRAGVTAGAWARARGIDGRSLHAWKLNLERPSPAPARATRTAVARCDLVELVPTARAVPSTARYVLDLGGARLEFGDDASVATLRRVLEALRAC